MSQADSGAAGQTTNFHFVANGDLGNVSWSTEPDALGNFLSGFVSVVRGGTASNPEVLLFYEVLQCGSDGCGAVEEGAGPIERGDLTGNGVQKLKVNTNTSGNPNFVLFAGSGGLVSVQWVRIPGLEQRVSGTFVQRVKGVFSSRSTGTSNFFTATATGSVVGFPITTSFQFAQIGTGHNVEIDHTFNR
ncbi:MAG TPA: hypothetical protein VE091_03315 [Gemmatimonadales bacterium]|nr:hypothetical protein [Gemmatimonadales bacterium]